jgi:hypothetical protein
MLTSMGTKPRADDQLRRERLSDAGRQQRADCCSANAAYRVVLPAQESRLRPAELLLCGHHFRRSRIALNEQLAAVFDADDLPIDPALELLP